MNDPLGLTRCADCNNAFTYDRDPVETERRFGDPDGAQFICKFCSRRDPVGIVEIADRLNVQRATVDQWLARGLPPEPRYTVGGRPAWNWHEIQAWALQTGRLKSKGA